MEIRAAEISDIIKRQIKEYERELEVRETGLVLSAGDGIARIYGLDKAAAGELLEFPHDIFGLVLNLEEDNVGAALFGEPQAIKEGDEVRRTGRIAEVPVGEALLGRVVNALGQPIDGKGPIETNEHPPHRAEGARHHRAPAGEGAAADRHQGHRRDDPDRPRPARADHRRPPDRQDRRRHRHDHQPEAAATCICIYVAIGQKRSTVAQVVDKLAALRRHGVHDRRRRHRLRAGAAAVHRALHRLHDGRVLPRQRPPRAGHLRRSLQAGRRLPPALAAAAPPAGPRGVSRATSSTCTRACSSAPPR